MLSGFGLWGLGVFSLAAIPYLLIAAAIVVVVVKTLKIAKAVDEISRSMRAVDRRLQKVADAVGEPKSE